MDIYEAIDALERIYDSNVPMMDNEEATMFAEALESVWQFAQKYEPQKALPLEFTCTCGKYLLRHDIYADMSRFMCDNCEAEWLIGSKEV